MSCQVAPLHINIDVACCPCSSWACTILSSPPPPHTPLLFSLTTHANGICRPAELPALLAVPCRAEAVLYSLAVGVHNGRVFVGHQHLLECLELLQDPGGITLAPLQAVAEDQHHPEQTSAESEGELATAGCRPLLLSVPQDELVVIVLELLATPVMHSGDHATHLHARQGRSAPEEDAAPKTTHAPVLLGRAVLSPFAHVQPDGSSAHLVNGPLQASFEGGKACVPVLLGGNATEGLLPLRWRALLRDTALRGIPDPCVTLELTSTAAGAFPATPLEALESAHSQQHAATVHPPVLEPTAAAAALIPRDSPATTAVQNDGGQQAEAAAAPPLPERPSVPPVLAETRSTRSLRRAAAALEDAASIPVAELPGPGPAAPHMPQRRTRTQPAASFDAQLQQLAAAMQQQIGALASAVARLQEVCICV
jgi:hypothetical protein